MRKFLLKLKFWFKYRRIKFELRDAKERILTLKRRYENKLSTQKAFYEKELAKERLARQIRDDAWSDRFLELQKVRATSFTTADIDERVNVEPEYQEHSKKQKYELNRNQLELLEEYREDYFKFGKENNRDEAEILALWESEGYENAVNAVMNDITLIQ